MASSIPTNMPAVPALAPSSPPASAEPGRSATGDAAADLPAGSAVPEMGAEELRQRYESVLQRVASATARSGRRPEDVLVIAVTKHATPEQIKALYALGHSDFGENRVQHLIQRHAMMEEHVRRRGMLVQTRRQLAGPLGDEPERAGHPIRWHMIGHLQRNKAKKALECIRLVHSVDSLRLAEEIQQIGHKHDRVYEILLQVNSTEEESKFGCPWPAARYLAEQLDSMVHLRVRGLMTMAPTPREGESEHRTASLARSSFGRTRELFEDIRTMGIADGKFDLLSMGMSGDFEIALEEGANLVRVGSAIFGDRSVGDEPDEPAERELDDSDDDAEDRSDQG